MSVDRRYLDGKRPAPPPPGPTPTDEGLATVLAATRERLPGGEEQARRDRPAPSRRGWTLAAVAVAAVVVLAALFLWYPYVYVHPGSSSASVGTTPGVPTSFYQTLPTAGATAKGSYWDWANPNQPPLVFAEGLASPRALGAVANASHLGTFTCAATILSKGITALPALSGPVTTGVALGWLFAYQATGSTLVVVAVVNGTSAIVASTPDDGACYNGPGSFSAVPVDSEVAVANASVTSVSKTFFTDAAANSSVVSAEFLLVPPAFVPHTTEPMWIILDTTCPLYSGSASSGETLTSEMVGTTGALYSQTSVSVTC